MTRFCCLTFPYFYAVAAARAEPSLRGKPLVVCAAGRVIGFSPDVEARGVGIGWSLARVQAAVPDAVPVAHHAATTSLVWNELLERLFTFTPLVEPIRAGHVFTDCEPSKKILRLLRVWKAQAGLADDRTTAELAAFSATNGMLRGVHAGRSLDFLESLPVTVLASVGIDDDTLVRLNLFGLNTVGKLRPITARQMVSQFDCAATLLHYAAAHETTPLKPYQRFPVVTQRIHFEEAVSEPGDISPAVELALQRACEQLDGRQAATVTISFETGSRWRRKQQILREPTSALRQLVQIGQVLLAGLYATRCLVSCVEVALGGLRLPRAVQPLLFGLARPPVVPVLRQLETRFPGRMLRVVPLSPGSCLAEARHSLEPFFAADAVKQTPPPKKGARAKRAARSRR